MIDYLDKSVLLHPQIFINRGFEPQIVNYYGN